MHRAYFSEKYEQLKQLLQHAPRALLVEKAVIRKEIRRGPNFSPGMWENTLENVAFRWAWERGL